MKRTDKLKKMLEDKNYTEVSVEWHNYTMAMETGGVGGGYIADTEENSIMFLGLSFDEAVDFISNLKKWKMK